MWEKGKGGRIAQTLATGLLLPDDVHAFEEGMEESVGHRLKWHTIAVTPFSSIIYHFLYFVVVLTSVFVSVRLNLINHFVGFIPCQICLYFSN